MLGLGREVILVPTSMMEVLSLTHPQFFFFAKLKEKNRFSIFRTTKEELYCTQIDPCDFPSASQKAR